MGRVFFAVYGPLIRAVLLLCREDSTYRFWRQPRLEVAREDARELWSFLRSRELVPEPRFRAEEPLHNL